MITRYVLIVFFLTAIFGGCRAEQLSVRSEYALGTICSIELFEKGDSALYERLFSRLAGLDLILSANRDDSELAALNRSAGTGPVPVSPELFAVLERALYFAGVSAGAFDPCVGPLVKLWGIGSADPVVPMEGEIRAALDLLNREDIILVPQGITAAGSGVSPMVFLRRPGMTLDLGAIAKGYAADELVRILEEENTGRAIIDLGGNIYVYGSRDGRDPVKGKLWRIGVQNPLSERGRYIGVMELLNTSVVTSGVYERYFTGEDGRRYHHILDTATGRPVENGLLSVTVIARSSMDADALSTTCFVLGYEKGRLLAEAHNARALFVFEDRTIRTTAGMEGFTLTDNSFIRSGHKTDGIKPDGR